MKALKLSYLFILISIFAFSCKETITETEYVYLDTYTVSGTVSYVDGVAGGAYVYIAEGEAPTANYFSVTVTDEDGVYAFPNLKPGNYFIFANYYTGNPAARLNGLNFLSDDSNLITVVDADLTKGVELKSAGAAGVVVNNIAEVGDWTSDYTHSELLFEFPYDDGNATFSGRFSGWEIEMDFDDSDLANSTINASVDLTTVYTGQPGRDGGHNCISRTFGLVWSDLDGDGTAGELSATNLDEGGNELGDDVTLDGTGEATFESTNIDFYGDGYVVTGDFTFNGATSEVKMYIKWFPGWLKADGTMQYSSFESMFDFDAINNHAISSGHVQDMVSVYTSFQLRLPIAL